MDPFSLIDPSQRTPVPSWLFLIFYFLFYLDSWRPILHFGCVGDLLPVSGQCSVRTLPPADAFLMRLWGEVSPTSSKSVVLLDSVPFEFFDMITISIRKVIQNQLVGNYSHISQRGFFLVKAEESITWNVIVNILQSFPNCCCEFPFTLLLNYLYIPLSPKQPLTNVKISDISEIKYLFCIFSSLNFLSCPTSLINLIIFLFKMH